MTTTPIPLGITDDQLDALRSEPMLAYHPDAIDALLDRIADLPEPDRDAAITEAIAAMPTWTLPSNLLYRVKDES